MSDGKEMSGMEDKAVSTMDLENINDGYYGETHWNALAIEKLLTVLINNKIMHMRAMSTIDFDSERSESYIEDSKEKEPPDRRSKHHNHHSPRHHRHHYCQKHSYHEEQQQQRSSISKVQKWSDDLEMDLSSEHRCRLEEDGPRCSVERKKPKEGYLVVDIESNKTGPPKKRKRKKRKKGTGKKNVSRIDPEDLPKRARWTIIITSGLLILTCMFLVGVTLRMAPVIDQMVRTKNEELMNSLNRNNNPAYYSSVNPPPN